MQTVILLAVVSILIMALSACLNLASVTRDNSCTKAKWRDLFDENIALENKAFNVARQYDLGAIDE